MKEHPPFGTAPIRCGRTRCSWRGYEIEAWERKQRAQAQQKGPA
ncbi:hypothetical protein [Delftia tsuruhatensis]